MDSKAEKPVVDTATAEALAELTAWASQSSETVTEPLNQNNIGTEDAPCLQQHQIRNLFTLAKSVKGCPLPESMMPQAPR